MPLDSFKTFISDALGHLSQGAKEDVMTNNFVSYLRQMFPDNPQWVSHYVSGIETSVRLYRRNTNTTGSIDVFVDGTVIEFEKNLGNTALFNHGFDQVKEYCASKIRSGVNIDKLIGVLSDTLNWYFYKVVEIPGLSPSSYNTSNIVLTLLRDVRITVSDDNSAIALRNCLNEFLGRKGACPLSAASLKDDFGVDSYWGSRYLNEAKQFILSLSASKPAYASLIHDIWSHFVEGIDLSIDSSTGSYEYEFYIATLAKLLCANILEKQPLLSNDDELVEIVSGDYFQRLGYVNFVEYDYFGWINEHLVGSSFIQHLRKIQQDLAIYDYSTIPEEDIFGRLLSQLSVDTKRILLGQELTPQWLSDEVVKSVASRLPEGEWPRFIDMCCGSGSMLISTIRYCSNTLNNSPLSEDDKYSILSSAAMGIDIDPLAVLLAKINWIINTESFCQNRTEIVIPVYHADSLFISSPVSANPSAFVLNIDGNQIALPRFLLNSSFDEFFSLLIEKIAQTIDSDLTSPEYEYIVRGCASEAGVIIPVQNETDVFTFAFVLYTTLRDLHQRDRNGIWAFLIKNSFKPALISRKFNGLVSNTPWMALSEVKDNPYKNNLSIKANAYGIMPAGQSFLHLELATVFLVHSIDSYLSDGAAYGCILPYSILKGKQHDLFRANMHYASSHPFDMTKDEIWDLPVDTFPNRAVVLIGHKNSAPAATISGRKYTSCSSYQTSQVYDLSGAGRRLWSFDQSGFSSLTPTYVFPQGADILPRPYFYFDLQGWGPKYRIKSLDRRTSQYGFFLTAGKVQYGISPSVVPKQFFRKTLVSNVILPFTICDYPLALIPYKRDEQTGEQRCFSEAEFSALPVPVLKLFKKLRKDYQTFRNDIVDLYGDGVHALNYINKLTKQKFLVDKYLIVYGAGGSNIAAAYTLLTQDNVNVVVDQTLYYLLVDSHDKAAFITGLLNSVVMSEAIATFQPSGRFGERHIHTLPRYFLPEYDPTNTTHTDFVAAVHSLETELGSLISTNAQVQNYLNPNLSTLAVRRTHMSNAIKNLNSFNEYDRLSRLIIV